MSAVPLTGLVSICRCQNLPESSLTELMSTELCIVMVLTLPPTPPLPYRQGCWDTRKPDAIKCVVQLFAVNALCARTKKSSCLYAGLPPAYIVLAECDIVHDEGEMYAQKLLDAGNTVHVKDYKGACHGHMMMAVDASIGGLKCQHGLEAIDDLCKMLAHLFKAS